MELPVKRSYPLTDYSNEPAGPVFSFSMKVSVKLTAMYLMLVILLYSCGSSDRPEFPVPDVSDVTADLTVLRFDEALMNVDTNNVAPAVTGLDQPFGSFTDNYFRYAIPLRRGDFSPEEQVDVLRAFLSYPLVRETFRMTQDKFDDDSLNDQEQELEQALRYYRHFLPDAPIPDTLVTFVSQFQFAGFLYGEGQLAAGLDFFLAPDFDYLSVDARDPIFSDYLTSTYTPDHLTEKMIRLLLDDYLPRPRAGRLIDYIVYEGKKLYLLNRVLPNAQDHILHEVSPEQMEWLRSNETAIFALLQKENQFYSTDPSLVKKMTQPAPYSQGMPRESPGRAVNYLGQQIVEAYVRANPQVTHQELLQELDGQKILAGARYKPRG